MNSTKINQDFFKYKKRRTEKYFWNYDFILKSNEDNDDDDRR